MKRIFIVRHGQTKWNLEKRLQGVHGDSPILTDETAMRNYQHLGDYLAQYSYATVYSSPLPRSLTTAKKVLHSMNQAQHPIHLITNLRELSFGEWEGQSRATLLADHTELFRKLSQRVDDPAFATLGMENFQQAGQRFAMVIRQLTDKMAPDTNILVFSHGGVIQLGIEQLTENQHLSGLKNLSTSIVTLKDDCFELEVYNQTGYLPMVNLDEGNVSI